MTRPRTGARLQAAYDLGHEHGSSDAPGTMPDYIAADPDLAAAWDQGFTDATDAADAPSSSTTSTSTAAGNRQGKAGAGGRRHRAKPTATGPSSSTPRRSSSSSSSSKFSHPLHWGTGARGHTVGRPTLSPPSRLTIRDTSGFAFGMILYALGINYLRYGPAGMTSWLSAKFVNRPTLPPSTPGTGYPPLAPANPAGGSHSAVK